MAFAISAFDQRYSLIAQLVEQLTVNQLVAGSSPAQGAIQRPALDFANTGLNSLVIAAIFRQTPGQYACVDQLARV